MLYDGILKGEKIGLRMVELDDCNATYLDWLGDSQVNQYLETRWEEQTLDKIKDFVRSIRESSHSYLFAMIFQGEHIGNIKIGPIHPVYKYADVSYFIGAKSAWGKGIATEAIGLVTDFSFEKLSLHRLQAGAYEDNIGSQKALIKNGYSQEGIFRKKCLRAIDNQFTDVYEYALLREDWLKA